MVSNDGAQDSESVSRNIKDCELLRLRFRLRRAQPYTKPTALARTLDPRPPRGPRAREARMRRSYSTFYFINL